jgi:CheY-like chemotaxis protein
LPCRRARNSAGGSEPQSGWASTPIYAKPYAPRLPVDVSQAYPILLVEDRADDVFFMERALQKTHLKHPLRVVTDGQKAIEYLSGEDDYSDRTAFPFPGLVIVDLKMPGISGFEVVEWMRKNPATRLTPIIVLSSSSLPADINRTYELGANAYMVKPPDHRALERLLQTIGEFWLATEGPTPGWNRGMATATL